MQRSCAGQLVALIALLAPTPRATADFLVRSGDLAAELSGVVIPGADSEAFDPPSAAELADWEAVIRALLSEDYVTAAALADDLQFDLIQFNDTATGGVYYLLKEQVVGGGPAHGQGTFVYNPRWRRQLNLQAPHAVADWNTRAVTIRMFIELQATFMQVAGTHRCANDERTPCDGSTKQCRNAGDPSSIPYRISDAAHFNEGFYQITSNEVSNHFPELVSVSVHGFTPTCDPQATSSLVVISNGSDAYYPDSLATILAQAYDALIPATYPGFGGGSCNAHPSDPEYRVWPCDNNPFCGQTNTQGRYINGSPDACSTSIAPSGPERFIHLEQQRVLRESPPGSTWPGVSYQLTIDAFADVFSSAQWVDFFYPGPVENGSFSQPYNSLAEGVSNADVGAIIRIKAGQTTQALTINKRVLLTSFGGSAVLGT